VPVQDVDIASVARLVGERARAAMLTALLDGRALTAGELARISGVAPATASEHLGKLVDAGLVSIRAQGRHRYVRLAGPEVATLLEAMAAVGRPVPSTSLRQSAAARALGPARMCFDHLAGGLGVGIADHLRRIGGIELHDDGLALTPTGIAWFDHLGVDLAAAATQRRALLRPCLDWTERRDHLAGAAAAALARTALEEGWVRRRASGQRGLIVTERGVQRFTGAVPADVLSAASAADGRATGGAGRAH
jgi:DNA-binding transcriptional ArsR family regulator